MKLLGTIAVIILLVEKSFRPRLDYTRDKKLLLWYGKKQRNYLQII